MTAPGARTPGMTTAPDITPEDWPLLMILIDVQRGKIGTLTALARIRTLTQTEATNDGQVLP